LTKENTRFKTGHFTLKLERPGRWRVSGRDTEGKYRRFRFNAKDLTEAIARAEGLLRNRPDQKRKNQGRLDDPPRIRISEALIRSTEARNWSKYTRQKDSYNCEYFLEWVDQEGLRFWHDLRFEHIERYKKSLNDQGLAFDTIRLYLLPVRRAAAWVAANWPRHYANICQSLRLSRQETRSAEYSEDEGNPYLPICRVLDLLDWLARDPVRDRLTVAVALQGLAGLQLQEALRLTWEKVDLQAETITIDGAVKNRFRIRRIPVANVVAWIFRRARSTLGETGLLVPAYAEFDNYSHALTRELRRWDPEVSIKPKDLRNTIQTAAIDGGWYGYYVQRYVGHAPATIGERHYHGDQGKRLVPLFREHVVSRIEAEIAAWKGPADSHILPGPRLVVNE
jgi:integrase